MFQLKLCLFAFLEFYERLPLVIVLQLSIDLGLFLLNILDKSKGTDFKLIISRFVLIFHIVFFSGLSSLLWSFRFFLCDTTKLIVLLFSGRFYDHL